MRIRFVAILLSLFAIVSLLSPPPARAQEHRNLSVLVGDRAGGLVPQAVHEPSINSLVSLGDGTVLPALDHGLGRQSDRIVEVHVRVAERSRRAPGLAEEKTNA